MTTPPLQLPREVGVVNVGLPMFADAVAAQGRPAVQVDWRAPAGGDPEVLAALLRVSGTRAGQVDEANAEVLRRLDSGVPRLVGVRPAGEVVPGLEGRVLLHAGPALELGDAGDPLRRSMRAAVVAEGWATDVSAADVLLASGQVRLAPANESGGVVPMATVMGPTTPVWVVALEEAGLTSWAPLGQGSGDVAWFGKDSPGAVERLVLLREAVAPVLAEVLRDSGPVEVLNLAAQGVAMGDDVHVRTQAATNLLLKHLLPSLMASEHERRVEVGRYLSANHLLFLTLAMACARALTGWAAQVQGSSVVTTMARNGTLFGARLSGCDTWFLAAAAALTAELERVCVGRSTRFTLPTLGGRGTPLAVDVRKVVEHQITPKVTTGILHRSDGG